VRADLVLDELPQRVAHHLHFFGPFVHGDGAYFTLRAQLPRPRISPSGWASRAPMTSVDAYG